MQHHGSDNFSKFIEAMRVEDYSSAMVAFIQSLQEDPAGKPVEFVHERFIKPVLEYDLMHNPDCAPTVKNQEIHALLMLLQAKDHDYPYSREVGMKLGRAGLGEVGSFVFLRSKDDLLEHDVLVRAEAVFNKPFRLADLLNFEMHCNPMQSLPSLCYLYLKNPQAYLPYNCPRSNEVYGQYHIFSSCIDEPAMLNGLDKVMVECKKAPAARKAALALDLLQSIDPRKLDAIKPVLIDKLGEKLVEKAEKLQASQIKAKTGKTKHAACDSSLDPVA